MQLSSEPFLNIVKFTPLVSIDLIIRDDSGLVLLGKRTNRPAQGYWFVPGGRILKNENFDQAIRRISQTEIGQTFTRQQAAFCGVFEHFYRDNFAASPGIDTHYVVLAYQVFLNVSAAIMADPQHSELKWWGVDELMDSPLVHDNTKAYFFR